MGDQLDANLEKNHERLALVGQSAPVKWDFRFGVIHSLLWLWHETMAAWNWTGADGGLRGMTGPAPLC